MRSFCLVVFLLYSALYLTAQRTVGLITNTKGSSNGYVLFAPLYSKTTYLVDKCGKLVHSWTSEYLPSQSVYLLPNGNLLRSGNDTSNKLIPANGGHIELLDWDSKRVWHYTISNGKERQHHDICPMPNGNVLVIAYSKRSREEALAAGRDSAAAKTGVQAEKIIEIKPIGRDSGMVVWQWDVWDHLVQERDSTLANYGKVAQNPQLLHLNYNPFPLMDWLHFNSVTYNAELDQILFSSYHLNELYIIDHSTTTAQAASHKGGRYGRGGDILYRWGNPATYNRGTTTDQQLFGQHYPHWIERGKPGAGKIMIFNNGYNRPGEKYSSVEIIDPPMDAKGNYKLADKEHFGPANSSWNYTAPEPTRFFSKNISGAQRLANGNTLICSGSSGRFFEINADKKIVWEYICPVGFEIAQQGARSEHATSKTSGHVFRCTFYEPSYSAFKGRELKPGNPIELNPGSYPCLME
jgi:hypothetical protein